MTHLDVVVGGAGNDSQREEYAAGDGQEGRHLTPKRGASWNSPIVVEDRNRRSIKGSDRSRGTKDTS